MLLIKGAYRGFCVSGNQPHILTSLSLCLCVSFSQHVIKQGQQSGHSRLMTVTLVSLRINKATATGQESGGGVWKCVSVCCHSVSFCDCQQNGFFYAYQSCHTERALSPSLTRIKKHTPSVAPESLAWPPNGLFVLRCFVPPLSCLLSNKTHAIIHTKAFTHAARAHTNTHNDNLELIYT